MSNEISSNILLRNKPLIKFYLIYSAKNSSVFFCKEKLLTQFDLDNLNGIFNLNKSLAAKQTDRLV